MPKTITDSGGSEIEVFTAEEIEVQKQEAVEQYKSENPDKTEELESLQKERDDAQSSLEEVNKKLEGELDKDKNFAELRKQKESLEERLKGFDSEIKQQVESAKSEIFEGVNKDHYNEVLKTLAGDDDNLKKEIEANYGRLADTAETKEAITKKLNDAYRLSVAPAEQDAMNTAVVSSGRAAAARPKATTKLTPEEMTVGSKLGLTAEDFEKYDK